MEQNGKVCDRDDKWNECKPALLNITSADKQNEREAGQRETNWQTMQLNSKRIQY